jgi:hypothetical protein
MKNVLRLVPLLFLAVTFLLHPPPASGSGHGDAPALAEDPGASIGDVFAFVDPTDATQTVLIATVHGYIVPGVVNSFAVFDPGIRYRFEIYNDHVNDATTPTLDPNASAKAKAAFVQRVKPSGTIDITFSRRQVGSGSQQNSGGQSVPEDLRQPLPQAATIKLTGFKGARDKGVYSEDNAQQPLQVTPFGPHAIPSAFALHQIDNVSNAKGIGFFAGEVSDPFFFDLPAFNAFLDSIRAGTPNVGVFSRARNTYAGYNILAIALRIPNEFLVGTKGSKIGVDFLTQRPQVRLTTNAGPKYSGALKTVDRMGNPLISVALVPYDSKNSYSIAAAKDDVALKFAPQIIQTLQDLGLIANPPEAAYTALTGLAIAKGDLLVLDTSINNTGTNSQAAFPNGRRLQDDTVDYILTKLNHQNTLSDGVNASDMPLSATFPYLGLPHAPLFNTNVDDSTRN